MKIVCLDLETTSLDPASGDIIEVAAVAFDWETERELKRFAALTKPRHPIPEIVTSLTGITQAMVDDKPFFGTIREEVMRFIEPDDVVVAHNADFDVNFLAHHGVTLPNPIWDTFRLAWVAWPEAESYNLGMLCRQLGVPPSQEHRALADVLLTWELLQHIRNSLVAPDSDSRDQVMALLAKSGLERYQPLFSQPPLKKAGTPVPTPSSEQALHASYSAPVPVPLSRDILNQASIEDFFKTQGYFHERLASFEPRAAQLECAQEAFSLLQSRKIGLIEAHPGTGKTLAYLTAALLHTVRSEKKIPIVVATYTRYLQDQLMERDIPAVLEALGLRERCPVASLKGRRHYLCTTRLKEFMNRHSLSEPEGWMGLKIFLWLTHGGSGELERINFSHHGQLAHLFHADAVGCRLRCRDERCFYRAARRKATHASLIVINHALLGQLIDNQEAFVPLENVIVDEAHHLPESMRQAARRDLTLAQVTLFCEYMGEIASSLPQDVKKLLQQELNHLPRDYKRILEEALTFLEQHSPHATLLLTPVWQKSRAWQQWQGRAREWCGHLKLLLGLIQGAEKKISPQQIRAWQEAVGEARLFLSGFTDFVEGNRERIQWLQRQGDVAFGNIDEVFSLNDAPLLLGSFLAPLFKPESAIILTSATLRTSARFTYIKDMLGIPSAAEKVVHTSSFDYKKQMMIYVLDDAPLPTHPQYTLYIAEVIHIVAQLLGGRTLVLGTSHKIVRDLFYTLKKYLYKDNLNLLAQKITGSRQLLLDRFRHDPGNVLLGTSSFWEGIDVPGEHLSGLIIPKLPFPVPDDPVSEALTLSQNLDGFLQLHLPEMLLRLRQGVGRLLRHPRDKGVVVLGDPRFLRSQYGGDIWKSLPPATINIGPRHELAQTVEKWFGEDLIFRWKSQGEKPPPPNKK
jgi:predicted DnaQ family exonuclease/DinG family helicase